MPKSFLMSGKRKKLLEVLYKEQEVPEDESETSSVDSCGDSGVADSMACSDTSTSPEHQRDDKVSSPLNLSERSAFEPILRYNTTSTHSKLTPEVAYGQMYPHPMFRTLQKTDALSTPPLQMYPSPAFAISLPPLPTVCVKGVPSDPTCPWTTVDTSIPFTTYLMNLSKLLQKSPRNEDNSESDDCKSEIDCTPQRNDNKIKHDYDVQKLRQPDTEVMSAHMPGVASVMKRDLTPEQHTPYGRLYPKSNRHFPLGGVTHGVGGLHPAFLQLEGLHHRRTHTDKPPPVKKYKCDTCGKSFSRSNTLVTHKRIHTGDKPFKCEQCGRAFRQPGNLTRHRLTHTTFKPYVCATCNKAFNRASNLHTHMRTHTNYKPFLCPYCGKGFHQKIDMKIHCYTHTGERPHKCDICGKGFTLASTLTAHRRSHVLENTRVNTHAREQTVMCQLCGVSFLHQSDLTTHIMTSHQNHIPVPV
ncbi:zinc finger protein 554-like [Haliotis rubra]|uniref:zinc finger protein 554-like n=1 Tax=Haliotis rubra TaxID=36100 RepID=UPI001EE5BF20|nr:zinc finger protein 554-like [Haliotis rubra]